MKTYDLFGEVPEKVEKKEHWPTPRATEWKDPRGKTGNRSSEDKAKAGWTLSEKAKMFPTPVRADGERGSKTYMRGNPTLRGAALSSPSMCSSVDSPAKISAWQAKALALTEPGAVFGGRCSESLGSFDPDTFVLKTYQASLLGGLTPFSGRWPRSGMMRNGRLYQRPRLVPRTLENESLLWPTPTVAEMKTGCGYQMSGGKDYPTLTGAVGAAPARGGKMWPTPTNSMMTIGDVEQARFAGSDPRRPDYETANRLIPTPTSRDWKSSNASPETMARNARPLNETVTGGKTGSLNADWVELLMGFLKGHTDIGGPKKKARRSSGKKAGKKARPEPSDDSPTG